MTARTEAHTSPSLRRRRLGIALRRLREESGTTREAAGGKLDCSPSKISRIENGDVGVRRRDLEELLDLYGLADADERAKLADLARESRERGGWWIKYTDLPKAYLKYIEFESVARSIRWFEMSTVPGALQIPEFTESLIRGSDPSFTPDELARQLDVRRERQRTLTAPGGPDCAFVLGEAAIRYRVGGDDVWRRQLRHLLELADRPNIRLQVLAFDHGAHEAMAGSFQIMHHQKPDPAVVNCEGFAGHFVMDDPVDVERCSQVFDRLSASALSPQLSLKLIAEAAA
ncbi:helix-turn-helix domain-containing protein [Phytomonospora endophytica]|uniref:Transcriptional regulator with XRE-family HTH domain n=1 Tax=Phytomonospora endophytica TaxID=714109 RepID=A0A841FJ93_9ACTN|nr:helix-turn-helix transcriptional regulator [Phytomonospora endophytica]MBB6036266.1 transcriptional regulator with XRE-family HTH domain [Phytomonospora endophytica]GIG67173.1 transcriptional regulator [Phytomonospora endophytica]